MTGSLASSSLARARNGPAALGIEGGSFACAMLVAMTSELQAIGHNAVRLWLSPNSHLDKSSFS